MSWRVLVPALATLWCGLADPCAAASDAAATAATAVAARHRAVPSTAARPAPRPVAGTAFPRKLRAEMGAFAAALAEREGVPLSWLMAQLGKARHLAAVQRLVMPPPAGQAKNWQAYRDRFVEPRRIDAGLAFWRDNARWLERAEAEYGVPPEIVVSIVGVETFYGRHLGRYRVLDALATLGFDFPPGRKDRSAFFRSELEAFLLWSHRESFDATVPLGSYAGAIGLPQFMPSSVRKHGVDFDGDGHIDLRANAADVVGSVARFLADAGWQRGLATHFAVQPPAAEADRATLLAPDIRPSFTAAQFTALGAVLDPAGQAHEGPLALVALENGGREWSYVAGSANFYAVTRYNWSSYYAMAVITLAQALRAAH